MVAGPVGCPVSDVSVESAPVVVGVIEGVVGRVEGIVIIEGVVSTSSEGSPSPMALTAVTM